MSTLVHQSMLWLVISSVLVIQVQAKPKAQNISWNCYGAIKAGAEGALLYLRGDGETGPGADTVAIRPRLNQKEVLMTLTAVSPPSPHVFYPGTHLEANGISRIYKDPSGNRWKYQYFSERVAFLMIEGNGSLNCAPI
tara:strand:- start:139 stop:552 length:414 start_codon:yes stop_codon:yes gene_type:complete